MKYTAHTIKTTDGKYIYGRGTVEQILAILGNNKTEGIVDGQNVKLHDEIITKKDGKKSENARVTIVTIKDS